MTFVNRQWKIITAINLVLVIVAAAFLFIRINSYNFAYTYFGERVYNAQYWLHPNNQWIENIEYSKSGRGFVAGALVNEDGTTTVAYYLDGVTSNLNLSTNSKLFFTGNREFPEETSYQKFVLEIAENKQFSYTCNGQTFDTLFCYYFIND